MRTRRWGVLLVLAGTMVCASGARAQESAKEGIAVIEAPAEMPIRDFLDRMAGATGKTLIYDPNNTRIAKQTLGAGFRHEVPADRVFDTFRAILTFYELTLVPVGPHGHEIWLVLDSRSTNNLVRNKAITVPYEELDDYADRDGLFITCAIPVERVENVTMLRTALATMVSSGGIGRVCEVPGPKVLIVTDFAPVVFGMAQLLRAADAACPEPLLESIELKHADARTMADTLTQLLAMPAPAPRAPQAMGDGVPPRVLAWAQRNALVISADGETLERIRGLVSKLDQPVSSERVTRILALREAGARYVAAVLESTLKARGKEAGVAADPQSNAVIVSGDKAVVALLRDLVATLEEICATL